MIRTSWASRLALGLADALALGACLGLGYVLRFRYGLLEVVSAATPPPQEYARAYLAALVVFGAVLASRGLYTNVPKRRFDVVEQTWGAVCLAGAILLAATFFVREFSYSRAVGLMTWAGALLALPWPRLLYLDWRQRRYRRGLDLTPALVIGTDERAAQVAGRLDALRRDGLRVVGLLASEAEAAPDAAQSPPLLGGLAQLEAEAARQGVREVFVADELPRQLLFETLERCEALGLEVRLLPQVLDLFVTADDLGEVRGLPYISLREHRLSGASAAAKRALDLALGGLLLVLAAPLIGLLAWLIRRDGEGPALFAQRRIGQGGALFTIWKLRSMVGDAEARLGQIVDLERLPDPIWKDPQDPRVTPLGRWLRRFSLDELPQLYNVVRGDMSLVGPRPEVEGVARGYDAHHRRRLKAKPGLTGLQQVLARGSLDLEERLQLDIYYTRRRTFLFDLWILLKTPLAVLRGRGAY